MPKVCYNLEGTYGSFKRKRTKDTKDNRKASLKAETK
jgi:hypothetical protein